MQKVSLEEARIRLNELIKSAISGEEIYIISNDDQLSIKLVPHKEKKTKRRFGSAKGSIIISDNFDEPLEDFKDYM
jgi:antitoxin (DNA-binding transcriptional repressor) of toxin-antitoxin stability system